MSEPAAEVGERRDLLGSIGIVAEALPDALVAVDESGRIVLVNAEAVRLLGWPRSELVGSTVERLVPTRLRIRHTRHRARYERAAASRPMGRNLRLAVMTSHGAELPVDISLMPIRSAEGRYTLATIRDLRERRRTESRLAESETRFLAVFEHATFGMAVVDPGARVVQVNGALEDLLDCDDAELVGAHARAIVVPRDAARLTTAIGALLRGEVEFLEERVQLACNDDAVVDAQVALAAVRAGAAAPSAVLMQFRELDEATRARARLAIAEENYRRLVEEIPLVTYVQRADGAFEYVSPQIKTLLGYPAERWVADPDAYENALHPDDREVVVARRAVEAIRGAAEECDYRLVDRDGRVVWVRDKATFELGDDGRPASRRGFLLDVSDRQRLETRLREAEKLQAVGRLAGGIAHDFNNLLTVISLAGGQLRAQLADARRRDADRVVEAAERGAALTRQLLAFSRRQMLQPTYLDVDEIVSGMDAMLRRLIEADVELTTSLSAGPGSVNADRSQIEQVIVNLVVNARDAMPRGGRLSIGTATVELEGSAARKLGVDPGSYVRLWVGDTGVGMDEELHSTIFEPYFTTKAEAGGSGLGLATVHGIVLQSGGAIEVESAPGEGTTFSVYLRLVEREPNGARSPGKGNGEHATGSETVLLVEDEEPVRTLAERALTAAGYAVTTAASGGEGLQLAFRCEGGFDLVITDVVMPGMSGPEFAERLQEAHPRTRVLYMSGYADDMLVERGISDDRLSFLEKPFSGARLAARVRAVLEQDPGDDRGAAGSH